MDGVTQNINSSTVSSQVVFHISPQIKQNKKYSVCSDSNKQSVIW